MSDKKYPCYVMKKDGSGNWYWIYYGKNYEPIARSSESYGAKGDCEKSIGLLKKSGNDPTYSE